ncbi:prefoldin subunit alpha [Candidatus Woesearchaeota archaeon]|nr:prefoldin subunit alpha [Candidatus Woesearchaeota archaeon]
MTSQREKLIELQMMHQQMKQIQKHLELMEEGLGELISAQESLKEIGTLKEGTQILLPLTNGVFTKAQLADQNMFLVNVGAGVVVGKTLEQVQKLLEDQAEEMAKQQHELAETLENLSTKASELQEELR